MIIPIPTHVEEALNEPTDKEKWSQIAEYWKCEDWKCSKCEAVMFGHMKYCIYCKIRLNTHTPKP